MEESVIAFVGDTHGHLSHMYSSLLQWEQRTRIKVEAVVQVGDFGFWPAEVKGKSLGEFKEYLSEEVWCPIRTYFVRGNHEDQFRLLELEKQFPGSGPICVAQNIYWVPDGEVVDLSGWKIGFVGGAFSPKTWEIPYWERQGRQTTHMSKERMDKLPRSLDILVAHDAPWGIGLVGPSNINLPPDEMNGGCIHLNRFIEEVQPQYAFFGHWHQRLETRMGETKIVVLDKVDEETPLDRGVYYLSTR